MPAKPLKFLPLIIGSICYPLFANARYTFEPENCSQIMGQPHLYSTCDYYAQKHAEDALKASGIDTDKLRELSNTNVTPTYRNDVEPIDFEYHQFKVNTDD